jgi:hypothetical protein
VIPTLKKRRIHMKGNSRIRGSQVLAAALLMSLFFIATSQAQTDLLVFAGKFTLTDQVQWDKTVLQPGDYTIIIRSGSMLTLVLVRDSRGRAVARFMSGIDSGKTSARNALLIKEKGGQMHVYSLELASLGKVLVYDRALARAAVLDARSPDSASAVGRTVGEAAIDRNLRGSVAGLRCPLTVHQGATALLHRCMAYNVTRIERSLYGYPIATAAFERRVSAGPGQFPDHFGRARSTNRSANLLLRGPRASDL